MRHPHRRAVGVATSLAIALWISASGVATQRPGSDERATSAPRGAGAEAPAPAASFADADRAPAASQRALRRDAVGVAVASRDGVAPQRASEASVGVPGAAIRLAPAHWTADRLDVSVTAFDGAAPRALELWRLDAPDGSARRVGSATSGADGRALFEAVLLPAGGAALVASPRGAGPGDANASAPIALAARPPARPQLRRLVDEGGPARLRIEAAPGSRLRAETRRSRQLSADAVALELDWDAAPHAALRVASQRGHAARSPWVEIDASTLAHFAWFEHESGGATRAAEEGRR